MVKLHIDDYICKGILNNPISDGIFKHIHPNIITIIGLISIILFSCIYFEDNLSSYKTNKNIAILLFIKYITDILDGAVARKYKKESKHGNFLDTLSDYTFFYLMGQIIINNLNLPPHYSIYTFIVLIISIYYFDLLTSHNSVKTDSIISYIVGNGYIIYYLCYKYIAYNL